MTTLAANAQMFFEDISYDVKNDMPVVAADIIYGGAAVGDNASGYMRPLVAGDPFRGFALSKADNASGAAGAIDVNLAVRGYVKLAVTSVAITDVGRPVYASDDATFALAGIGTKIGVVHRFISSGVAMVEFGGAAAVEKIVVLAFDVPLATIVDGALITGVVPGFNGRFIKMEAVATTVVTTGSKLSTLNAEISGTNVTGGTLALTSATLDALGDRIVSAAATALAGFKSTDILDFEGASTTTFIEGEITLLVYLGQ